MRAFTSIPGYRLLGRLGEGMNGVVYLARREADGRDVALKVAATEPDSLRQRFRREVEALVEHPHPCLVPVVDADLAAAQPYLALAYLEGGDLVRFTLPETLLPLPTVVEVAQRVTRALAHLHARGCLHRDVKPANVLLDSKGAAYLADLGLLQAEGASRLTAEGKVVGTPAYMAPEVLRGGPASEASDLYALGVLVLELLTGARPEHTPDGPGFAWGAHPRLEASGLKGLLRRCLRRRPEDRPAAATEVLAALEAAGHGPPQVPTTPAAASGPGRAAWAAVFVVGLALGALAPGAGEGRRRAFEPLPEATVSGRHQGRDWVLQLPVEATGQRVVLREPEGLLVAFERPARDGLPWVLVALDEAGFLRWVRHLAEAPEAATPREVSLRGGARLARPR